MQERFESATPDAASLTMRLSRAPGPSRRTLRRPASRAGMALLHVHRARWRCLEQCCISCGSASVQFRSARDSCLRTRRSSCRSSALFCKPQPSPVAWLHSNANPRGRSTDRQDTSGSRSSIVNLELSVDSRMLVYGTRLFIIIPVSSSFFSSSRRLYRQSAAC